MPANWSMTGELSLKGEVAQIGGIGAKLIASKSLNIDQIIVPRANYEEALDLPQNLLKGLTVYFVKEYAEIFKLIFEGEEKGVLRIRNGVVQEEETLAKEL